MTSKTEIDAIWKDIEAWLAEHAPDRAAELRPGASDAAIEALEKKIGHKLPADYVASLARHDGAANLSSYVYQDSKSVAASWEAMRETPTEGREIDAPEAKVIKPVWWNKAWVPFAEDSGGNLLCLDLDPGPKGKKGQVLVFEMSMGPGPEGHASFGEWLADYRDGLKAGRFVVDDGGFIYEG